MHNHPQAASAPRHATWRCGCVCSSAEAPWTAARSSRLRLWTRPTALKSSGQGVENPMVERSAFYGLGWDVSYDDHDRIRWNYSGAFNLGAATCVNVLPAEQVGIVALTNAYPIGVPEAVCRAYLDLLLNGKIERDWLALLGPPGQKAMAPEYGTAVGLFEDARAAFPGACGRRLCRRLSQRSVRPDRIVRTDAGLVLKLGPGKICLPCATSTAIRSSTSRSARMRMAPVPCYPWSEPIRRRCR